VYIIQNDLSSLTGIELHPGQEPRGVFGGSVPKLCLIIFFQTYNTNKSLA